MTPKTTSGFAAFIALLAVLALPTAAAAEALVPPGNSAVNQYTESFPTAGGQKETRNRADRTPAQVLGQRNARRLEAKGPSGEAAAALAAVTAPETDALVTGSSGDTARAAGRDSAGVSATPGGSSRFDSVLGQATDLSSERSSVLLPLIVLASTLWALAYLWRRRRPAP